MRKSFFLTALTILFFAINLWAHENCGTIRAIERLSQKSEHNILPYTAKKNSCKTEDYYKNVYSKKTNHFEIFYTLDGPHKTTHEFVNYTATIAEKIWSFYIDKIGMLAPYPKDSAFHYQKKVSDGLYPIEIIDLDLVRNPSLILGGTKCGGCFGITNGNKASQKTQIFLDNDFFYVPDYKIIYDSLKLNEESCHYWMATKALENPSHNYLYTENWSNGIRVALYHEFYHAIQFRYLDLFSNHNFWFEASATAFEEIGAPDIDDYFRYLESFFSTLNKNMDYSESNYASGILLLYLYNHVDKFIDKKIWEAFSKEPKKNFQNILASVLKTKGLNADSIFQDFATRLSFSGTRSKTIDSSFWINEDQNKWPNVRFNYSLNFFIPDTTHFAYSFYTNGFPNLNNYKGEAGVILFKDGKANIKKVKNSASVDSIQAKALHYDSLSWIFSRFNEIIPIEIQKKDSSLRAFPSPWRGGPLCFTPLPLNKNFIEIRNRRGDLIIRETYNEPLHCIEESFIKSKMAPGIYRFRVGSYGKTKDFLIIY